MSIEGSRLGSGCYIQWTLQNDFGGRVSQNTFIKEVAHKRRYPCAALFSTIMVDKDGFIYPCCMGVAHGRESDICLGNIG